MKQSAIRALSFLLFVVALPAVTWAQEPPVPLTDEASGPSTDEAPTTTDEAPGTSTNDAPALSTDATPVLVTDETAPTLVIEKHEPAAQQPRQDSIVVSASEEERRWDYGGDESWIINYKLPRDVFELQLSAGVSRGFDEVPVHAEKTGGREYGPMFSAQVAWRLDYIFSPFLDVGWAHLVTSETTADTSFGELNTEATLSALHLNGGILFDIWYLRARLGAGFNYMMMSASVDGAELSTGDWDFGYAVGLGGTFWRAHGFQVGLEGRGFLNPALETGYVSLGLFGSYDLITF